LAQDQVQPCYIGKATRNHPKSVQHENFHLLSFLGVNWNMKCKWRTLHCAFGGKWLCSLPVEHAIAMINMKIQHYGTETTLAKKLMDSIKALQLEITALATHSAKTTTNSIIWQLGVGLKASGNNFTSTVCAALRVLIIGDAPTEQCYTSHNVLDSWLQGDTITVTQPLSPYPQGNFPVRLGNCMRRILCFDILKTTRHQRRNGATIIICISQ
jgi:hypothetical protein